MSNINIPGFYFDQAKNRYFRITNQASPSEQKNIAININSSDIKNKKKSRNKVTNSTNNDDDDAQHETFLKGLYRLSEVEKNLQTGINPDLYGYLRDLNLLDYNDIQLENLGFGPPKLYKCLETMNHVSSLKLCGNHLIYDSPMGNFRYFILFSLISFFF